MMFENLVPRSMWLAWGLGYTIENALGGGGRVKSLVLTDDDKEKLGSIDNESRVGLVGMYFDGKPPKIMVTEDDLLGLQAFLQTLGISEDN